MEMLGKRSEESFTQRINEKDLLIAEQEKVILSRELLLTELRTAEESFAQTLKEKDLFISEKTAIITEHELSLTRLREELVHVGRTTDENIMHESNEKDLIIAEKERIISERDCSLTQLKDELESSVKNQRDLQEQIAAKVSELEKCVDELLSTKSDLESCKSEVESCKLELEKERTELESCKGELATSRQKERMSSNEIMQLMGTVEDLQKRYHQGSLSESDTVQKMQEETTRKLDVLRAELDEMYEKVEQVSHSLISQESQQGELQRLQETIDNLKSELAAAQEAAEEVEARHDSEITNYKIKLEMLEREKDCCA
ncbi:A-kinase anchor protein 9 [Larimichthys crocea]|uniref:A-kinase anchor protein 9 n=1 Tax=Larimichthys crocea TaxID=215358 RepID=A0A6G0HRR1_LARCR|nr:A-kinase anchor protein 9 [Larimichthys crocea]